MKYRFVGRFHKSGIPYKIPYGEVVERVRWFARRKVLVKRSDGELVVTMGYLLRKVRTGTLEDFM